MGTIGGTMENDKTVIVYGPQLLEYDFGGDHPFGSLRARLTYELMRELGLLEREGVMVIAPGHATRDELLRFHTAEYLDFVQNASVIGRGFLDNGDTPAFEGAYDAAACIAGSSWDVTRRVATG